MRKNILLVAGLLSLGLLAGCSNAAKEETKALEQTQAESASEQTQAEEKQEQAELKTIKVGASPSPHAEILEVAKKALEEEGYKLEIVEYTDYVQPNNALDSGEIDANYFQHYPYLEQFNTQYNTKIVSAAAVHYEPFGIYAGKTASLEELKDGAKIAVPNDVTNEARALLLLSAQGLITLKEGADLTATKNDIVENPKNIELLEIEAAQLPRSLQDVDVAVINGNYAIEAGFKVKEALAVEDASSVAATTYANIVAVREGDEKSEATLALIKALESEEVKKFIEDKYEGAVVPLF